MRLVVDVEQHFSLVKIASSENSCSGQKYIFENSANDEHAG